MNPNSAFRRCLLQACFVAMFLQAFGSSFLAAEEAAKPVEETPIETRSTIWGLGLAVNQQARKSGDGNHLLGISSMVQLSRGYIGSNWYASISLDIISGPYQSPKQQDLVVDFSGTGTTAIVAISAENQSLRTKQGNYGFLLGINYADVVGRSVGRRFTEEGGVTIDNWVMRVNDFSLYPAIFFCWLAEARPIGNTPELLQTRIEGYFLTIGFSTPLQSRYNLSYQENGIAQRARGNLRGYSILVSFATLFGS